MAPLKELADGLERAVAASENPRAGDESARILLVGPGRHCLPRFIFVFQF